MYAFNVFFQELNFHPRNFFAGELSRFHLTMEMPFRAGKRTVLNPTSIIDAVGEGKASEPSICSSTHRHVVITSHTPMLEQISGPRKLVATLADVKDFSNPAQSSLMLSSGGHRD